jgi:hypothetical protein
MAAAQPQTSDFDIGSYLAALRTQESGGNDKAASSAGAIGRYQFEPGTWRGVIERHPDLGLQLGDINDPAKQDLGIRALTSDNAAILKKAGLQETSSNLYLLHFLGAGAGPKFLEAMANNPAAPAAEMFPTEARYNPTIFYKNDGSPRTLGEVYALQTKRFGGEAPAGQIPAAMTAEDKSVQKPQDAPVALPAGLTLYDNVKPIGGATAAPSLPKGLKLFDNVKPAEPVKVDPKAAYQQDIGPTDAALMSIGADPYAIPAYEKHAQEVGKGVLSGAGQMGTGVGELIPGKIGDESAAGTRYLQGIGDPFAQELTKIGLSAIPFLGATGRLAEIGPASAALRGAGAGFLAGAAQPTGEESEANRYAVKGTDAVLGAGLGGAAPLVSEGVRFATGVPNIFRSASGKEASRAAEALRGDIGDQAGAAASAEARTAEEKGVSGELKERELSAHEKELLRLEQAQQEVASAEKKRASAAIIGRDPLTGRPIGGSRDVAQATNLTEDAEIRARVAARLRQRVSDAEREARKAGASEDEARRFAVEQERAETRAVESADKIVQEQAARPIETPEALGKKIHDAAVADMEKLKQTRREESGFEKAVNADNGRPSVSTASLVPKINQLERDTKVPEFKSTLDWLRKSLFTATNGGKPTSAVSIKQTREILEEMNRRIDSLPNGPAHELEALKDELQNKLEQTHPGMKTAREKYAELSRPLDVYERTGALSKAVKTDPYNDRAIVDPTRIVGAVLNKTEAGADALGRLVQKNLEMQDVARRYFNQQLFGAPGAQRTPSLIQFNNFIRDNRLALDRAGLTKEFVDLKSAREAGQAAIDRAKAAAKEAADSVRTAQSGVREAENRVSEERSLSQRAARREQEIISGKNATSPEDIGKNAERRTKEAASRLSEQAREASGRLSESRRSLETIQKERETAQSAQRDYQRLSIELNEKNLDPKQVPGKANEIAKKLSKEGRITDEQYDKLLGEIKSIQDKFTDAEKAATAIKKALGYAIGGAVGEAGLSYLIRRRIF